MREAPTAHPPPAHPLPFRSIPPPPFPRHPLCPRGGYLHDPQKKSDQSPALPSLQELPNGPSSEYDHRMDLEPFFLPHAEEAFSAPETTVSVWHDLFPAEVSFTISPVGSPDASTSQLTLPKCRVLIGPEGVFVFIDAPRGPALAFYDTVAEGSLSGEWRTGYDLAPATLLDIESVQIRPTNRCGCGSRLRGYRPFGRISYAPQPEEASA